MSSKKTQCSSSVVAFHPQSVIYLSLELKTCHYDGDYSEEALKALNQRPMLSDYPVCVQISDGDLCQSSAPALHSQKLEVWISVTSLVQGLMQQIINMNLHFRLLSRMRSDILG